MSYKTDIATLRTKLKELGYKQIPNVLDIDSEDFSTAYENMGYTLLPHTIDNEQVTNDSLIGERGYRLTTTYKAQDSAEYDNVWDKYEALFRAMHVLSKAIDENSLEKYEGKQFIYLGKLEFNYGGADC